jgi:WD40 repeat protein
VLALGFSPEEQTLVSGSKDGSLRVWRIESGKETVMAKAHPPGVRAVVFSPDGKQIASGGWDSRVKVWDSASGKNLREFKTERVVQAVAWSPDGKYIAAGCDGGTVVVWNMSEPEDRVVLRGHVSAVSAVKFVERESILISGSADGRVCIWSTDDWSHVRELEESSPVMAAAVSMDGRYLATGCEDGQVRIRDLGNLSSVRLARVQPNLVRSLAAGWGSVYAAGGHSEKIVLFDAQGDKLLELEDIKNPASAIAFGAKGRYLAAGSDSGVIYIWEAQ